MARQNRAILNGPAGTTASTVKTRDDRILEYWGTDAKHGELYGSPSSIACRIANLGLCCSRTIVMATLTRHKLASENIYGDIRFGGNT